MLLRFRVSNYASIRDEAELSLVAATRHEDIAVRSASGTNAEALPVAAIYGANASGKSNVVDAFFFMREAILESHQNWRPGTPINRRAFKLDASSRHDQTMFGIDFILEDVRYEYGFSLRDYEVSNEWLLSFPNKRERLIFNRHAGAGIEFGPSLTGLRRNIEKLMRPNSLYLSTAAANNHPQLSKIYNWFASEVFLVRAGADLGGSVTLHEWQSNDRTPLRDLLRYADTGVIDLEVTKREIPEQAAEKLFEFLQAISADAPENGPVSMGPIIEFIHRGTGDTARFTMGEESSGTLAWLLLVGPVVTALRRGGLLVVDELDARLHPLLAAHLVNLFQSPDTNQNGAQLVFNTHNVSLLGPSAPGRLRRDQVWFTEKDDSGATRLTALAEYRVRDGLENVEKRYLSGRYGAIPFLDGVVLESLRGA
jgi:AAA15 family ATPase/GTPase